jgi:hypothetical protein
MEDTQLFTINSSGNYIIDTLYLYTRNANDLLNGNRAKLDIPAKNDILCINALKYIFDNAVDNRLITKGPQNMLPMDIFQNTFALPQTSTPKDAPGDLHKIESIIGDFHNSISGVFQLLDSSDSDTINVSNISGKISTLNWNVFENKIDISALNKLFGAVRWSKTPEELQVIIDRKIGDLIKSELSTKNRPLLGGGYVPPHLRGRQPNPEQRQLEEEEALKKQEEEAERQREEEEAERQREEEHLKQLAEEEDKKVQSILRKTRTDKQNIKIANEIKSEKWILEKIKYTFSYVSLLFSIALLQNWDFTYNSDIKDENNKLNLQRRNGLIIIFITIFITYFKPVLDDIYNINTYENTSELTVEIYNNLIEFVNKLIYYHNSYIDSIGKLSNKKIESTYNIHFSKSRELSKLKNITKNIKSHDDSYNLLEAYNNSKYITDNGKYNNEKYISNILPQLNNVFSAAFLNFDILKPSDPQNTQKLLLPTLPTSAAWAPKVNKTHGLSQIDLGNLLDKLDLKMCMSDLGLFNNEATQFKVTGIPNIISDSLKNYLWQYNFTTKDLSREFYAELNPNFTLVDYLKSILFFHKKNIGKFYILTAINTHYDSVSHTKIGSFGFHVKQDAIQQVIINCEKTKNRVAILTGYSEPDENSLKLAKLVNIQSAHRVMTIFDMRDVLNGKIYYFEPFGQYYPVYDIYGRSVPYMQELVVSKQVYQIFAKIYNTPDPNKLPWKVIVPLYESESDSQTQKNKKIKYCSTAIFNVANTKMYGLQPYEYTQINNLINTTELIGDKTYDWIIGYCGLITLFMTVLIRLNCIPTLSQSYSQTNPRNVDDIYLWFNEFNKNPFYTFDNLLSKFLIRGFINLIDGIKSGKIHMITPKIYNLHELRGTFESKKIHNLKKTLKLKNKSLSESTENDSSETTTTAENQPYNDMIPTLLNIAGINISELEKHKSGTELKSTNAKLNTIALYLYKSIFGDANPNSHIMDLHLDPELNSKLAKKYGYISDVKKKVAERKQGELLEQPVNTEQSKKSSKKSENIDEKIERKYAPYKTGKTIKTWLAKPFTKKRQVRFGPETYTDIFITDSNGVIRFNSKPVIPRVLFIDTTQSN